MSGGYCDVHYLPIEAWCVDCKHDFCETCIGLRYRGVRVPDDLLCEDCEEKREEQNTLPNVGTHTAPTEVGRNEGR